MKAKRVWAKLQKKVSVEILEQLHAAFLSEEAGIENVLFKYIQSVVSNNKNIEGDFSNFFVLTLRQVAARVCHEAHRMTGFIRFQQARDHLYFSVIEPDHNILPLITFHFKKRFADQRWLIYDQKRNYGIYYDLSLITEVTLTPYSDASSRALGLALHEDEALYQQLWKAYFKSTNNPARKNTKLHIQLLPKRYWKHLTEKLTSP